MGQMTYLRMGQGLLGGPLTYSKLKDIVIGLILRPHLELVLCNINCIKIVSQHFINNDYSRYKDF